MPKDVCIVCKKERQIMYASGVCDDCIALISKVREEMEETLCRPSRIYDKDDESNLVREIYDTVNRLNSLVARAVKEHGFSVFWDILEIREVQDAFPMPHLNMTVMTKVE